MGIGGGIGGGIVAVPVHPEGVCVLLCFLAVALERDLTCDVIPAAHGDVEGVVGLVEPHPAGHMGVPESRTVAGPQWNVLVTLLGPQNSTALYVCSRQTLHTNERSTALNIKGA